MGSDKLTINKQTAMSLFNQLSNHEKSMIGGTLMKTKQNYMMGNITTDVPYFFWCTNTPLFANVSQEDNDDFLNIKTAMDFGIYAVFYIAQFLLDKRR